MKSKVIKSITFIAILLILLAILSNILIPKKNSKEAGIHYDDASGIMAEKKDTIDLVVMGDSEPYTAIIPMELWEKYGYTSYLCCGMELKLTKAMQMLKHIFEKQTPKMILLDANFFFRSVDTSDAIESVLDVSLPVFEYHNRWKTLSSNDLKKHSKYDMKYNQKGYYYTVQTVACEENDIMNPPEGITYISRMNKMCLRIIKKYCNDKNIKLMFFRTPTNKDWNYASYAGVKEFADKENIEYWDMNFEKEKLQLDYSKDSKDGEDHLNYWGALKTTKVLGEKLESLNILPDHRGDKEYSSWDETYKIYKEMVDF